MGTNKKVRKGNTSLESLSTRTLPHVKNEAERIIFNVRSRDLVYDARVVDKVISRLNEDFLACDDMFCFYRSVPLQATQHCDSLVIVYPKTMNRYVNFKC